MKQHIRLSIRKCVQALRMVREGFHKISPTSLGMVDVAELSEQLCMHMRKSEGGACTGQLT